VNAVTQQFPFHFKLLNNAIRELGILMPLHPRYLDRLGPDERRLVKRLFVRVVAFYVVLAVLFVVGAKYLEEASDQQHAAVHK
jgi:hypothetical protein